MIMLNHPRGPQRNVFGMAQSSVDEAVIVSDQSR